MSDIKNADSFLWEQDFTTISTTYYSPWFDVAFANVLYSFLTFEETGTAGSESITVTLERFMPYPDLDAVLTADPTALEVIGHTAIGTPGNEEKYIRASYDHDTVDTDNKIGMRVRYRAVSSSGAFGAGNTITMTLHLDAKRV